MEDQEDSEDQDSEDQEDIVEDITCHHRCHLITIIIVVMADTAADV